MVRAFLRDMSQRFAASLRTQDDDVYAVTTGGSHIYVNPSDARGKKLLETNGNFNPPALSIWQELLRSADWTFVLDVGANYGEMLANGGVPERAKIIAIEPNREILPYLKKTLRRIGRIKIYETAISDQEGVSQLLVTKDWSGTVRLVEGEGDVAVKTTTLEKIISAECRNIDATKIVLKIDVEGYEAKALSGLMPLLNRFQEFAAFIEVAHLSPDDKNWISDHFAIEAFDVEKGALVSVPNLNWTEDSGLYPYDVVIRRSPVPAAVAK
ncbi:FkbM family methyltransferase [Afipia felis]|uniref:Methyltransferase, FkbM family n=2 Tax=Afipia felis TaxID=1035 RepID=A0A380W3J4_AFIFE|nr:FkbM family methyltransferase [Afipia felis]EKS30298.1 FkbM family methyltransferase [Afipia felis ATCC 53690]SUU75043.1 methyltransferase, FkbM family [Afipia felis]SUU83109.1 methyltransferase, FkbM family [Afipia felis]